MFTAKPQQKTGKVEREQGCSLGAQGVQLPLFNLWSYWKYFLNFSTLFKICILTSVFDQNTKYCYSLAEIWCSVEY